MVVLDEDFGTGLTLVEGNGGVRLSPVSVPEHAPRDWRSQCERERARADAAEARAEELRWAEVAARSDGGSWKSRFKACRRRLSEAVEETKEARRTARDVPSLQAEVARLETLLSEAGIASAFDTAGALRKENARLRKALAASKAREGATGPWPAPPRRRTVLEPSPDQKETVRSLRTELRRLDKEVVRRDKEKLKARLAKLRAAGAMLSKLPSDEAAQLRAALRRSRRQKTTMNVLRKQNARLRRTVRKLETRKAALAVQPAKLRAIRKALESELAGLRAVRKTLSKSLSVADADLRRALRRSRRQKATIKSLSRENARLRKGAKTSRNRIETLEVQLERLRATGAVLSRALYGRKSEQQDKPGSEHKRGQQRGAPGHGRTQRPRLDERTEEHNPPPDACVCGRCGQPYAPNGAEESTLVEIEVKAYKRVIRRPRWRRTCECASSPMEVSAPPVPRLFPRTLYGTSFWARFLFEHCACFRPVHRVAAWMSAQGLTVSPGTLADSLKRFVPLLEPLAEAILAHQNKAALRHADETSWRVQELRGEDRSSRAWLWVSVSNDAVSFHIDPSRSAEAAQKLFGDALLDTVIVCDRYSAYKRLARLREGKVTLAFCWSHMRCDFVECAAGQVRLTDWCQGWIERIASIYRLNEARLAHYDPVIKRQTPAFDAAQGALKEALDGLFAEAARELVGLPDQARQGRALRSLLNHREGLSVFVDRPQVPLDNNRAERLLRGPAIGRRLSFGSDSEDGARFTAIMYSVVGTLSMNGIDILSWLDTWLAACAGERSQTTGRPVAVAAMVDERGAQARTHGAGVTGAIECRYYGRDFTAGEMALLRALIAGPPPLNRHMLSKEFCRRIGWFKPDGGLKDMMARVAMLAMHRDALIALPAPQGRQNRPRPIVFGPDTEAPLFPAPTTLDEVRPLDLRPVVRGTRESKLWNEFVARYHYLGYKTLVGAQMRYAVHDRDGWPLAMLGFSTAAWKLAPRDNFIGWTRQKREKNLPFVVDNPRFLILPWINIPNLGSHILAFIRRRLPDDWTERYNTTPVLIETFVETPRYTGAVYRASGWTRVGTTQGRGRYDRDRQSDKPKKDVWLRPLRRDWKRTLNR